MDFAVYVVRSLFSSMISSIDYSFRKDFSGHNSDTYLVIFYYFYALMDWYV